MGDLLLHPAPQNVEAEQSLLAEVDTVFTERDNQLLREIPTEQEVKMTINKSNIHAAPGCDGISFYLYQQCWDTIRDILTVTVHSTLKITFISIFHIFRSFEQEEKFIELSHWYHFFIHLI